MMEKTTWGLGSYYRIPSSRKRKNAVKPATREEVEAATELYFSEGGKIEKLERTENPGDLAQMRRADEFIFDGGIPEIF